MPNQGGVYSWSTTPATNSQADTTVNWSPGMSPSSVAPSGRAMMASVAKWRDDISGALVSTGTSTAYSVASNQNFDDATDLNNKIVAFTPNVTSGVNPTLAVDGIGPYPIQSAPNASLPAGVLVQGTPYVVIFNQASNAFYLQGFYNNPYSIPLGGMLDYIASTTPSSIFAFPANQAISRTTYSSLFALIGTTYGAGDGSTTFNLPDLRGRVVASPDNMGGFDAGRLSDANSSIASGRNTLGGVGGSVTHAVSQNEMPSHYHDINWSDPGHTHGGNYSNNASLTGTPGGSFNVIPTGNVNIPAAYTGITFTGAGGANTTLASGSSATHENVQPTILANRILRII